jgi:hypothetical protein
LPLGGAGDHPSGRLAALSWDRAVSPAAVRAYNGTSAPGVLARVALTREGLHW